MGKKFFAVGEDEYIAYSACVDMFIPEFYFQTREAAEAKVEALIDEMVEERFQNEMTRYEAEVAAKKHENAMAAHGIRSANWWVNGSKQPQKPYKNKIKRAEFEDRYRIEEMEFENE